MTEWFMLFSGLLFGLAFLNGIFLYLIPIAVLSLVFAWLNRVKPVQKDTPVEEHLVEEESTNTFVEESEEKSVLDQQEKKRHKMEIESEIDMFLFEAAKMMRKSIQGSYSVFIFFPGRGAQELSLRIYDSPSDSVDPKSKITLKHGLIGHLLKEETTQLLEGDIRGNSLFLYTKESEVKSIAGVPVLVNGKRNGAVVIDSIKANAFEKETIEILHSFAQVIGQLTYRTYMDFEHLYQREQYKALLDYQKRFLHTMSEKDIYKHIESFVRRTVPSDRLMVISRNEDSCRVVRCHGIDEDFFQNLEFSLQGKGLLSLCFHRHMEMQRSFRPGERVVRLVSDEKYNDSFRSLAAIPVFDENDEAIMVLCVESRSLARYSNHFLDLLRNIANVAGFAMARVRSYEEKQNLASRDGLTGLYNHRTFQGKLSQEIIRAKRMGASVGVIMMDIDHFKSVNDNYGHPIGDLVLKNNAAVIQKEVRSDADVLARYGGEEFVVLLVDATEEIVRDTAERIRKAVMAQSVEVGHPEPLKITLSLGYALFPEHGEDGKVILDKADKALYKAKTGGRNQAVGYK